jgi:hypothetical protein
MTLLDVSPFRFIFLLVCVNPTSALKATKAILDDVRAVSFRPANLYDVPDKSDLGNMRSANRRLREIAYCANFNTVKCPLSVGVGLLDAVQHQRGDGSYRLTSNPLQISVLVS